MSITPDEVRAKFAELGAKEADVGALFESVDDFCENYGKYRWILEWLIELLGWLPVPWAGTAAKFLAMIQKRLDQLCKIEDD